MGIRQTINENPAITSGVAIGIIVLVFVIMLYQCFRNSNPAGGTIPGANKQFFTTDDGKTYFPDDATNVPPYTVNKAGDPNNGKVAVRCQVFKCTDNVPFVSHLEKYADEDKKKLEDAMAQAKSKGGTLPLMYMSMGAQMMVKKPGTGDKGWVKLAQGKVQEYTAIMQPKCKDGTVNGLIRVNPE